MLSVKGVRIYDLCLVNPPPSSWGGGTRFQITIEYGNETKSSTKSKAKKSGANGDQCVVWNESFTFPGNIMNDSRITFTAIRRTQLISKTIGSSKQLVTDLLKIQNDSGSCKLAIAGKCYLTFNFEISSDVVSELVGEASGASAHLPDLGVPAGAANFITSAVQFYDEDNTWSSFLLQFQVFMKVMDNVSEISPYAKIAWGILSAIPKVIILQKNRDDKVKHLCGKMKDIYDYVTDAKRLPKLTTTQSKTLSVLVQQTIECAYFIRAYSAENSIVENMVKGVAMDNKIQRFNHKFDHLKQVMTDSVNLETGIVTLRVSEGISDLNDVALLEGMPYDSDAGFIPGKRCFPGTRQTLINKILEWVNSNTSPQILVLSGQAGAGKSAVAHTIAGLFREQNRLGSMFCFNRSYKDRRKYLFSTMARDLADGDTMWQKELVKAIKKAADRKSKDPQIQFEELIFRPSRNVPTIGSIVIVVDALDESGDRGERKEILQLLFNRCSELPKNYRIIVTSRPEQDIELHCQDTGVLCMRMGDNNSEETHSDIQTYISRFLAPISSILDKIDGYWCDILAKRAEGLFQWARTACEFIDPTIARSQLVQKKWKTCVSDSSSSLYGLYHEIISRQSESKDADFIKDFKTVVGAIMAAREPFSINALQNILPDIGDIRSILSPFGSLFAGAHDSFTPVRPLHTSLFDFFAAKNHPYYVDTSDQSIMAISCLRLMNRMLRFNICQLETSHRFNRDVPRFDLRVREAVPWHLRYSCDYWAIHLHHSHCGEELVREIRSFMDRNLLYWFEVLSLLGTVDQGCSAMRIMKNWCTDADNLGDLAADAMDACHFGYDFEDVMTDSTPHLYLSALPFTPRNSFVSKTYLAAYPRLFTFDIGLFIPVHSGSSPEIGIMRKHTKGHPTSLAFHPKGKYIATGSYYGEFWMWDYTTGELVHAYDDGRSNTIRSIVFSSDGELAYCCFYNGDLLVLNTKTNETRIESYAEIIGDWRHSFSISPDGRFLALCMENEALLYDRKNRLIIKQFEGRQSITWIYSPTFSPNGEFFAYAMHNQVCVWNTKQPLKRVLKAQVDGPVALNDSYAAFVRVFGSSRRTFLEIWDVRTGTKVTEIQHEPTKVMFIAFSPDNQYILSSSWRMYFIWNVSTGELISRSTMDHAIYCLSFSPDSKSIALGTWDGSTHVRQWDTSVQSGLHADVDNGIVLELWLRDTYLILVYQVDSQNYLQILDITTPNTVLFEAELAHQRPMITVYPDNLKEPDSDVVHVAYVTSRGLCLWDKTAKGEITVDESTHSVTALTSSSKYLVSADIDTDDGSLGGGGSIKIWNISTRGLIGGPYAISGRVEKLCVSANSISFIVAYDDNQIEVRQFEGGRIIGGPFKLESYPYVVAFSPDETRIICIQDQSAEIIDISTGRRVKWVLRMDDSVSPLSPNGKYLAGIDDDGRALKLLDTDTGMPLNIPSSSLGSPPLIELGFSNDSKQIIIASNSTGVDDSETASLDSVSVWDIQSGKMIVKLPFGFQKDIFGLHLSNGRLVFTGHDRSVAVWDMNTYEMMSTLYDSETHRNDTQLVDSPQGGCSTSRTEVPDYALTAWKKASFPAFAKPNKDDGWVWGLKNELLVWIPRERRMGFWSPCAVHVPYRNITKLNFDNFVHGTRWTECRNDIGSM